MDTLKSSQMLTRLAATSLLAAQPLACDEPDAALAPAAAPLSTADADTPPDTEDTSIRTTSEVVAPEPNPNNIESPEELRAAYERLLAESPEFRAAVQDTRPFDPSTPMRVLEPVPPPPVPEYCANDPTHGHPTATPPAPSARPGARDIIPHRYHSEVEPARRGLYRPAADRATLEDLNALIGTDLRWTPAGTGRDDAVPSPP